MDEHEQGNWGKRNNQLLQQILALVQELVKVLIPRPVKSLAVRFDKPTKQEQKNG